LEAPFSLFFFCFSYFPAVYPFCESALVAKSYCYVEVEGGDELAATDGSACLFE